MGSFDGAEICELVGLYILNDISELVGKENVGLYRDDGLAVIDRATGPKSDSRRKDIISIFQKHGLSITIEVNLQAVDFLDVTFDLAQNKYFPYRKPNDVPLYVNSSSNHPQSILKQIPDMINKRVSNLSCNEKEFKKVKDVYQSALKASGYDKDMNYIQKSDKKKSRQRKIIWFNPPFSNNAKTNVGKIFMSLVRKHFPRHHKFHKIFNPNTLKLSYSCMPNVESIIKQHNSKLLNPVHLNQLEPCNCRNPQQCPLDGKCLTKCIVYKSTVKTQNSEHVYFGIAEKEFKPRYRNHLSSFKLPQYENDTELSKFIWTLKEKGITYDICWSIATHAFPYKCGTSRCDLCLSEKVIIARSNHKGLLNKRTELLAKCRHKRKFLLGNVP